LYSIESVPRIRVGIRRDLIEAARDLSYLLNRGYGRKTSLNMVTSRYKLSKIERLFLYRCIYPQDVSKARSSKVVSDIKGLNIAVDGFNVLSTVQSALLSDTLVLSTDGFIRDLAATVRKVRVSPLMLSSLVIAASCLAKEEVNHTLFVYDSQVSKSLEICNLTKKILDGLGVNGRCILASRTDKYLMSFKDYVVSSSDSVILDRAEKLYDLGGRIALMEAPEDIIDINRYL